MRILVTDNLQEAGVTILRDAGFVVDVVAGKVPEAQLVESIGNYDGIIVRSGTRITATALAAAGALKVVGRAGSGVDNIDVPAASKKGVVVMNTPGGNTVTTAEHALAMLFALARSIPQAAASMRAGKWDKKGFVGTELTGKTLGILGMGNIGTVVARRALALGMKVQAYDPYLSQDKARQLGVSPGTLNEVLAQSDAVSIHVPASIETHHLINRERLAVMKAGALLINCARGGIVDESALLEALDSGHLAGAALDVFEVEPPPGDSPLLQHPNLIATPHLGASTMDAQVNVAVAIAEQFVDFLSHGIIANAINFPPIPKEAFARLRPYLVLAEKMAGFIAQLAPGSMEELQVEYSGDIPVEDLSPVTIAAVKGLLTPALQETVNHINAMTLAKERGIRILESRARVPRDYVSLITLKYRAGGQERSIAGTLFGKTEPRIVRLDSRRLELAPEGHLVILTNLDAPGVLGAVGSRLGHHGINIGGLQLGRNRQGGEAMSIINVDHGVSPAILKDLLDIENVTSAQYVSL